MKELERGQYQRLRRILEMIREGTQTGRLRNAGDFTAELGVCRRTILRDLDFLRDDEGAPVEYDGSKKGYRLTDATWQLRPVELSRTEVFAFAIARKLLGSFRGTPLELDMQSVLRKIGDSMEGRITTDLAAIPGRFEIVTEDYARQDPTVWKSVVICMEQNRSMEVRYRKFDGTERSYRLEPLHMAAYHGDWYVLARSVQGRDKPEASRDAHHSDPASNAENRGWPNGREPVVTFAMSRMRSVQPLQAHFEAPKHFDAKQHLQEGFGIVRGASVMDVRLLFSPNVATYIEGRTWHETQRMERRRDGRLELRLRTAGWKELVRWVLSWQPDVKVLAPKALRIRVIEKMRMGLQGEC